MKTRIIGCLCGVISLFVVGLAHSAPYFQAAGTASGGSGAVTVSWPAHIAGDVALLFVESAGGEPVALSTPSGFVEIAGSPQATGTGTSGTRLTVFWARATSSAMPSVTVADPGNHVYARILTYRGVINSGNPWDVTGGGVKASASRSVTVTGLTTTVADTLIVQAVSRDTDSSSALFSAETNANLAGITERADGGTTSGSGGGFAVWDGAFATSGSTGNTTASISTSAVNAFLTIALKPPATTGNVTVTMSPGSCVNATGIGSVAWTPSPTTNVNASDNLYATATVNGTTTNYLKCTNYGFTIPTTATIVGIVVNVERKSSGDRTSDAAMRLVKNDVIGSVDRSRVTTYTTTDTIEAHGASNDLWGTTWTPADVNLATFGAAFAAKATKGRTISVDHMPISVTYSAPPAAPHHIQIVHDGIGQTCAPEQLTVKACADAACSSNFTSAGVSGNITWAGSPGGTVSFSIASGGTGQTTVSLAVTTAQTITLGTSSVTPTPTAATSCTNQAGGTACSMTFTSSSLCMDAVEVGAAVGTAIHTKLAGTGFSLDLRTVSGANYTGTVSVELVDAAAGSCATYTQLNTQNVTFSNQQIKTVTFNYANAARIAKVRMTAGTTTPSCSSDKFAIRPVTLTVDSNSTANADAAGTSATATPVVKSGASFTLNATAVPGYSGTPAVNGAKMLAHAGAIATGVLGGAFGAANASTGVATGNAFTYGEVGYFKFDVEGVQDTTFADIDRLDGDCTSDFSNTSVGGKYGCYFGNAAATSYFGRFIPDHFDTVVTDECGVFTYSGQPFTLDVQAKDAAGATLQNYEGSFAKGIALSDALNSPAPGAFNPAVVPATDFTGGAATVTPAYTFANVKTAPAAVDVRAAEAAGGDGVSSATGAEGAANIRSGRVWMGSAYGSELLNLSVPVFAQYWDGTSFVTNVDDDVSAACTSVPIPAVTLQPGGTAVAATMSQADPLNPGTYAFVTGTPGLVLGAPGVAGNAVISLVVPAWLQYNWAGTGAANPSAQVHFGVYRGNNVFIYRGRRGR